LPETVGREALAEEALPKLARVFGQVSLAGGGNDEDDERIL
jgi:hypothetical protein